jgi:hypothetical protein
MSETTQFPTDDPAGFAAGVGADAGAIANDQAGAKGRMDPTKDSLSAARGIMLGVALSVPVWLLVGLAIYALSR